jgi:hypothetical protein
MRYKHCRRRNGTAVTSILLRYPSISNDTVSKNNYCDNGVMGHTPSEANVGVAATVPAKELALNSQCEYDSLLAFAHGSNAKCCTHARSADKLRCGCLLPSRPALCQSTTACVLTKFKLNRLL